MIVAIMLKDWGVKSSLTNYRKVTAVDKEVMQTREDNSL